MSDLDLGMMPDTAPEPEDIHIPEQKTTFGLDLNMVPDDDDMDQVRQNVRQTRSVTSQQAAKDAQVAQAAGMPQGMVERNRDEAYARDEQSRVESTVADTPGTRSFLQDRDNYALAKDDVENLSNAERALSGVTSISQYDPGFFERTGIKFQEGVKDLARSGVNSIRSLFDLWADLDKQALESLDPKYRKQILAERAEVEASPIAGLFQLEAAPTAQKLNEVANQETLQPDMLPEADSAIQRYFEDVVQMAPQIAAQIGAYVTGGAPLSMMFMGSQIAGGQYGQLVDSDEVDPARALVASWANAAMQAPLEQVGLSKAMSLFRMSGGTAAAIREAINVLGTEFVTEWLQAYPEAATEIWAKAEQRGQTPQEQVGLFFDDFLTTTTRGMYEGLVTLPFAALGGGGKVTYEYRKAVVMQREQEVFDALDQNMSENTMRTNGMDDKVVEAVERIKEANEGRMPEEVFIPAEAARTLYQNDPEVLEELVQKTGTEAQFQEAVETGGDWRIPIAPFVAHIAGTDESLRLAKDRKFSADGMTVNELEVAQKEMASEMQAELGRIQSEQEATTRIEQEADYIYKDIKEKRVASGVKVETAASDALVWAAHLSTYAKRGYIESPLAAYQSMLQPDIRNEEQVIADEEAGITYNQDGEINRDENFKNWFGESKVVDENGEPLVVYHGTNADFESFEMQPDRLKSSDWGEGFYFTPSGFSASFFAERSKELSPERSGASVIPAYISLQNPEIINLQKVSGLMRSGGIDGASDFTRRLKDAGKDGVIVINQDIDTETGEVVEEWVEEIVAFSPAQIKSVYNRGTFDPNDERILYQDEILEQEVTTNKPGTAKAYGHEAVDLTTFDEAKAFYQRAFHGSPYRFDKFTLDHMKAGEGAHVYGWGLYFAGQKKVAEWYRETLTAKDVTIDDERITPENYQINLIIGNTKNDMDLHTELLEYIEDYSDNPYADIATAELIVDAIDRGTFKRGSEGQLYEVEIPEDDVLLHWEQKFVDQPQVVQDALRDILAPPLLDPEVLSGLDDPEGLLSGEPEREIFDDYTGQQIYAELGQHESNPYRDQTSDSQEAASLWLNALGIKGLRYLDGSSRNTGGDTYNFVIFDDAAIDILNTFYQTDSLGFYSAIGRAVEGINFKLMPPKNLIQQIKKTPGIKQEELDDLGLIEWLEGVEGGKVSKEQVLEFIQKGGPQLEEVERGTFYDADQMEAAYNEMREILGQNNALDENAEEELDLWLSEPTEPNTDAMDELLEPYGYEVRDFTNQGTVDRWSTGNTKYSDYQLPGGENYREVLITVPTQTLSEEEARKVLNAGPEAKLSQADIEYASRKTAQEYNSQHWDEANVLAHFRLNDRTDAEGNKVLFIEEIQSDWHQEGRKKGYGPTETRAEFEARKAEAARIAAYVVHDGRGNDYDIRPLSAEEQRRIKYLEGFAQDGNLEGTEVQEWAALTSKARPATDEQMAAVQDAYVNWDEKRDPGVPDAPFKKSWQMLAFKRVLSMAVEQGYDSVAWTPGEVQVERYDLSKQADGIGATRNPDGTYAITAKMPDGSVNDINPNVPEDSLADYVGKDLAEKISQQKGVHHLYSGLDLKVGGEGMKGFYDKILPKEVGKYVKKLDKKAKVGVSTLARLDLDPDTYEGPLPTDDQINGSQEVWTLPITDKMRSKIQEGQPLYQSKHSGTRGVVHFNTPSGRPIIDLFQEANASTFLHETGHVFLEFTKHLALQPNAPQELKDDWASIVDHFGIKNNAVHREAHEEFARSLEAYFREGKAPSMKLRGVFQRFGDWLKTLYRSITKLDVNPSPELTALFDRMFATDKEIMEVKAYHAAQQPFFDVAAIEDEKARKAYERKLQKADEELKDKRLRKYLKAYLQAMGGKKKFRELANDEISTMPVYRAMDEMVEQGGLNLGDVEDLVGEERRKELVKKRPGMTKREGIHHPDIVAARYGYSSGVEMIAAMLDAPKKSDMVQTRLDELITAKEEEIVKGLQEKDAAPADEDYHSDARLAVLVAEFQMLQNQERLAKGREAQTLERIKTAAVREVARNLIKTKSVNEATSYTAYSRAEVRAAKEAKKYMDKGDLEMAAHYKKLEVLNHALVIEAVKAREEHAKLIKRMKATVKRAIGVKIDDRYGNQILQLMGQYGLTGYAPQEGTKSFDAFMENIIAGKDQDAPSPGSIPEWSSWLFDGSKLPQPGKTYKTTLTFANLEELAAAVHWLSETGYDIKEGRLASYKESLKELRDEMIEPMADLKNKKVWSKKFGPIRKWSDATRRFIAEHEMLTFLLDAADAFSNAGKNGTFGPNRRIIGNKLADAQSGRDTMTKEMVEKIQPFMDQFVESQKRLRKQHGRTLPVTVDLPAILKRDGDYWSFDMVIAIALNMGNETNIRRLKDGYGLSQDDLIEITSLLTQEDWRAVQGVWDAINGLWPQIDEVHYNLEHFHRDKVKAKGIEVRTADGETMTMKGGYYPLKYDSNLSKQVAGWNEKDDLMQGSLFGHPGVKNGLVQGRMQTVMLPVLLNLSVMNRHIEEAIHYITHAAVIRDIDRITQSTEYQRVFEDKFGAQTYKMIRPALRNIARPEYSVGTALDKGMDKMRALSTAYILGLNTSVALKQLFSLPGVWNDIGVGAYVKGLGKVLANPVQARQAMHEMSSYMATRSKSYDRDVKQATGKLWGGARGLKPGWLDQARDFSFALIQMMDFMAVYPSWWGAYQKGMQRDGDPVAASRYADEMIRQSQPSSKPMDMSEIQRSRKGLARLYTMFMTFTAKYGNRQRYYFRGWRAGEIDNKTYFRHVLLEAIAPPLLMNMMFAAMWGDDPDPEDMALDILLYQFAGYALVRDVAGAAVGSYKKHVLGKDAFVGNLADSPALTGLDLSTRTINALGRMIADMDDDEKVDKAAWTFVELTSFFSGVPAPKAYMKLMEGIRQFEEEDGATVFNLAAPDPKKRR